MVLEGTIQALVPKQKPSGAAPGAQFRSWMNLMLSVIVGLSGVVVHLVIRPIRSRRKVPLWLNDY